MWKCSNEECENSREEPKNQRFYYEEKPHKVIVDANGDIVDDSEDEKALQLIPKCSECDLEAEETD